MDWESQEVFSEDESVVSGRSRMTANSSVSHKRSIPASVFGQSVDDDDEDDDAAPVHKLDEEQIRKRNTEIERRNEEASRTARNYFSNVLDNEGLFNNFMISEAESESTSMSSSKNPTSRKRKKSASGVTMPSSTPSSSLRSSSIHEMRRSGSIHRSDDLSSVSSRHLDRSEDVSVYMDSEDENVLSRQPSTASIMRNARNRSGTSASSRPAASSTSMDFSDSVLFDNMISDTVADVTNNAATTAARDPNFGADNTRGRKQSTYAASFGKKYNDETTKPPNFDVFKPGKKNSYVFDGETLADREARKMVSELEVLYKHWVKKTNTEPYRSVTGGGGENVVNGEFALSFKQGKKLFNKIAGNSYRLMVEMVRRVNIEPLVENGSISTHPYNISENHLRNPSVRRPSSNNGGDGEISNDSEKMTVTTFRACLEMELRRLKNLEETIGHRSNLPDEEKLKASIYFHGLIRMMMSSFEIVTKTYIMLRSDPSVDGRLMAQYNALVSKEILENKLSLFLHGMSQKLYALNWKRGDVKKDWFYREHFIDGVIPSKYWVKVETVEKFVSSLVATDKGVDNISNFNFSLTAFDSIVSHVTADRADNGLFPRVKPSRGVISFRNGFLDMNAPLSFFRIGSPSYNAVFDKVEYECAYVYFDGNFDDEGFDPNTGLFDMDSVLPKIDPVTGKVDWNNPDSFPDRHWSKDGKRIPILQSILEIQKWDLHTMQNYYFSMGRLNFPNTDNKQFAPYLRGRPHSGKSTACLFALYMHPSEMRAIIPPNSEIVFGLQLLINKDEQFVKNILAITDMNGKLNLAAAVINTLVTGEFFTTSVKFGDPRTAKAVAPFLMAGNQFIEMSKNEMPALLRRFIQFVFDVLPSKLNDLVNHETIMAAMPAYVRRVAIVYHEHLRLQELSPIEKIRNDTNIWTFVSDQLKAVQKEEMEKVSVAAKFMGAADWIQFTGSETDILSVDSLRHASKIFHSSKQPNENSSLPTETRVTDAIYMIHKYAEIEAFGDNSFIDRFSQSNPSYLNGLPCQLGDTLDIKGAKYVVGLRISDERLEQVRTIFLRHLNKITTDYANGDGNSGDDAVPTISSSQTNNFFKIPNRPAKRAAPKATRRRKQTAAYEPESVDDFVATTPLTEATRTPAAFGSIDEIFDMDAA